MSNVGYALEGAYDDISSEVADTMFGRSLKGQGRKAQRQEGKEDKARVKKEAHQRWVEDKVAKKNKGRARRGLPPLSPEDYYGWDGAAEQVIDEEEYGALTRNDLFGGDPFDDAIKNIVFTPRPKPAPKPRPQPRPAPKPSGSKRGRYGAGDWPTPEYGALAALTRNDLFGSLDQADHYAEEFEPDAHVDAIEMAGGAIGVTGDQYDSLANAAVEDLFGS